MMQVVSRETPAATDTNNEAARAASFRVASLDSP